MLPESIKKLQEQFENLPGIGPRQASRFVFYLLKQPDAHLTELSRHIDDVRKNVALCTSCYLPTHKEEGKDALCRVCGDQKRDKNTIFIVEKETDAITMESSKLHNGIYFILGSNISPVDEEKRPTKRLNSLKKRIKDTENQLEIVLALNNTREGNFTSMYLERFIKKHAPDNVKVTKLGRGLSTGSELEYADEDTLRNALDSRS